MSDADGGAQWLTYKQLADLRGIKPRAAVRLSQRRGWRRQPGNDGATRVLVPDDMLETSQRPSQDDVAGDGRATPSLIARSVAALETALTEANGRADTALALADRTLAQLADADARADKLRTLLTETKGRANAMREERDIVRADHQKALQTVRRLEEANATRKARGRLRRAW